MTVLSLSLTFLFLFHVCLAFQPFHNHHHQNQCHIQKIEALRPNDRVPAEAGWTEFFNTSDQQFRCAGVEVIRHHIQPQALLLPSYINTPQMIYIIKGKGYQGIMLPGCPETFQSSEQLEERGAFQDRHQKIHRFRAGDVVVIPAGAAHWMYNDGKENVIVVALLDSTNSANQLDKFHRRFFLAGNPKLSDLQHQHPQDQWPEEGSGNVFHGFGVEVLAEAFNVDNETAQKLQNLDDLRGHVVAVERGLQVIKPQEEGPRGQRSGNGFEETICSAKFTSNINDVSRADFHNPQAGWTSHVNSFKLPILQMVKLSAERGVLQSNATVSPYWIMNAHSILFVTNGKMKVQIVNSEGEAVFDDMLEELHLVVVPQNFAVVKQAGEDGCEWISFRTNDNAMVNTLAGQTSVMRAMPVDVIVNAYQMSPEEAWRLKNNRKETVMFGLSSRFLERSSDD